MLSSTSSIWNSVHLTEFGNCHEFMAECGLAAHKIKVHLDVIDFAKLTLWERRLWQTKRETSISNESNDECFVKKTCFAPKLVRCPQNIYCNIQQSGQRDWARGWGLRAGSSGGSSGFLKVWIQAFKFYDSLSCTFNFQVYAQKVNKWIITTA